MAAGPVPVSAARAERDAIAAATSAGALQRKRNQSGGDPVAVARRIAAALNAPDIATEMLVASEFYWMTAVTIDGRIILANSYALGFIPDGILLPESVVLVSSDTRVPISDRARAATHPSSALQQWASHHNTRLRVVIATAEQFVGSDPGAAKIVLEPADIPPSGKMRGRDRLEVVAPGKAAQLATTDDLGLFELIPPAPTAAEAPADRLMEFWYGAMMPMVSTAPDRGVAHLQHFAAYAGNARDLALYAAHTAIHAEAQRAAVADWLYWNYLVELLAEAVPAAAMLS